MDPEGAVSEPAAEESAQVGWAIVELMGHRQVAGFVTEVSKFGAALMRIDVPGPDGTIVTQFYGGPAIYCITPTDEATARKAIASTYSLPPVVRAVLAKAPPDAEQRSLPYTGSRYDPDNDQDENPF